MPHADATSFPASATKNETYELMIEQAVALFDGQDNWVCNAANTASLLWHALHSLPSTVMTSHINWAGFYHLPTVESKTLVLGPFMGKVACQTIAIGKGVCGTAAKEARTVRVADVEAFPGHIACDGASRSEIVVPIVKSQKVVAIIDIDCEELDGFDEADQKHLEKLAQLLSEGCQWPGIA